MWRFLVFAVWFFLYGCLGKRTQGPPKIYQGAAVETYNMETRYSDSAIIRVKVNAPKELEYENADKHFPNGIFITFFNEKGVVSSTLTANEGKYAGSTGIYTAIGNVIIRSTEEKKRLNTELLHWNPETKKVYTDQFVRIETTEEILTGNGLEADQDFKRYRILHPTGIFSVGKP